MPLDNIIDKIRAKHSFFDTGIKKIYGNNRSFLAKGKKIYYSIKNTVPDKKINLEEIMEYLDKNVPIKNEISIVHSAYEPFMASNISPNIINDHLLSLSGSEGTVAMPAFRNVIREEEMFDPDLNKKLLTYDLKRTPVITGLLPHRLTKNKDAVISRFPINPLVAVGKYASAMMKNNLVGDIPAPHGKNSSWEFCLSSNATIIGLGTDLAQHLTMIHTVEDLNEEFWPIKNWYRSLNFEIIDGDIKINKTIKERRPEWSYNFADRILCKDLIKEKIMTSVKVQGITIEYLKSKDLYDFLLSKNNRGYPYFVSRRHLK